MIAIAVYSPIYYDNKAKAVVYTENWVNVLNEVAIASSFIAQDTETNELYEVRQESDEWYLRPAINPLTGKITNRKPIAWARLLDNFMEVLSSPCGTEFSNYCRFERIANPCGV